MRKWFASLAVLGLAVTAASAQTLNPLIGFESVGYDDGSAENSWKVINPTGAGDAFNVDFDTDAANRDILGVSMSTNATGSPTAILYIAICGDNLAVDPTGKTPDLGSPLSILNNPTPTPTVASGFCGQGYVAYDLPDVNSGSGLHAVMNFPTGDSVTWLCSDVTTNAGRSYFTTNNYATPAIPFSLNWMMRLAAGPNFGGQGGAFTINGSTSVTIAQNSPISLTFWSSCATQPTLYLQVLNVGTSLIPLPGTILQTGLLNFAPGPLANAGILAGTLPCSAPVGATITFSAFYADNCSLKKNGNPKIFLTNTASFTVSGNCSCNPCVAFGQKDDGVLDATIWKVQNPAGTADYFNVNLGANPCATTALNVEAASWDFCGTGPCWAEVGLYNANLVLDATGGTPLLPALTSVGGASACMAPGSATWAYPGTIYDFPDFALGTSAYHIATKWASGDSCTWIASDTDAIDDPGCLHGTIPSTASYFTIDAYATPALQFTATNWMMKLNWN